METDIDNYDFRIVIEFCMDIASAVAHKNREDFRFKYYGLVELGQIAHFFQALMRIKRENTMPMELFNRLASTFNIYQTMTVIDSDTGEEISAIEIHEDNVIINIDSYDGVIGYCKTKWNEFEEKGFIKENQKILIRILYSSLSPRKLEFFKKMCRDINLVKEIVDDCQILGILILHINGFYYSPRLFNSVEDKTLDLLSQYNITSNNIIEEMEKVNKCAAYPVDYLDERIKQATMEGAFKGILLPVTVELPDGRLRDFVFTNPKDLKYGDVSYETAAYFRYNEVYTLDRNGRLRSPSVFLNSLISRGIAGDATNIGRNYFPLELKGVLKVIEGSTSSKKRMVSLKPEVLKEAKILLESDFPPTLDGEPAPPSWLAEPAKFRARLKDSYTTKKQLLDLKDFLRDKG